MSTAADLEQRIKAHQQAYDKGKPTISDEEFDALIASLRKKAPHSAVLAEIGNAVTSRKMAHSTPMLSLQKAKTVEEVWKWAKDIGKVGYLLMPKYDGVSLSAHYEGKLVRAVTRGDGKLGDDVTHIAKHFLPTKIIPGSRKPVEVRGEVIFPKDKWETIKEVFSQRNNGKPVNARNAAAGTILRKTVTREATQLHFMIYDVLGSDLPPNLSSRLALVDPEIEFQCCALHLLMDWAEGMQKRALACNYETDGIVVRVDEFVHRKNLGATSHHPHWAIALKHEDEKLTTKVKDIHWQVSRTGTITPVAQVEPLQLSGVMVSNATLHHAGMVTKLEVSPGCTVEMTRRGGVIPHVERVTKRKKGVAHFEAPKRCPCCQAATKREGDFLQCSEPEECPDVQRGRLVYWCEQTDLMGFGEQVIKTLYDEGIVMMPSELYTLDAVVMRQMFGQTLGPKLVKEANSKARLTPAQLFCGLGIDGLGKTQAEKLFEAIDFDELMHLYFNDADEEIVSKLPKGAGFGTVLISNLFRGIAKNRGTIQNLVDVIEIIKPTKSNMQIGPFAGKKVVFTGQLSDMSRESAQQQVKDFGGSCPSSVTKDTAYLVVGSLADDGQLHKRQKALHYNTRGGNIQIIEEEKFIEMLVQATELKGDV